MSRNPEQIDFVIVTALQEELEAVLEVFGRNNFTTRHTSDNQLTTYHIDVPIGCSEAHHKVVAISMLGYGVTHAALVTPIILHEYLPFFILVVGTGGGIYPHVNLGDVAVSDHVIPCDLAKEIKPKMKQRSKISAILDYLLQRPVQQESNKSPRPLTIQQPSYFFQQVSAEARGSNWYSKISIPRPDGKSELTPRVLSGGYLSGSIVRSDDTSPEFLSLIQQNPKAVLVEMESAGVGRAMYMQATPRRVDYVGVRGISDLPNKPNAEVQRPEWSPYARQAAAAFAYAIITRTEKVSEDQSRNLEALEKYRNWFRTAIETVPLPDPRFDIRISCAKDYSSLNAGNYTASGQKIERLLEIALSNGRVILHGAGGAGKSVILRQVAALALDAGHIPVFFNLRKLEKEQEETWSKIGRHPHDFDERFDYLLQTSGLTDLTAGTLKEFPHYLRRIFFVDALDRTPTGRMAREVLELFDDYVRRTMRDACVIVSDRMGARTFLEGRWEITSVDAIKEDEVRQHVNNVADLSDIERQLLQLPYFLQLAISSGSGEFGSKPEAFKSYFIEQLGMTDLALKALTKAAFDVYRDAKSSTFSAQKFRELIGDDEFDRLKSDGALIVRGEDSAHFSHDLQHDYLASKYLADNRYRDDRIRADLWTGESFDALTFEANSFDALSLTLNQIGDREQRDEFIKAIYNWNFYGTIECMKDTLTAGPADRFSRELIIALLALVSEKLFDRVVPTRDRIRTIMKDFPSDVAKTFIEAQSFQQIVDFVRMVPSQILWFNDWRKLYVLPKDSSVSLDELKLISSPDSIVGWTVSNVLRRIQITESHLSYLRELYSRAVEGTIRWRIVHALGAFPTANNVDLLIRALDTDANTWVRYGAVRSLAEASALTIDEGLRDQILLHITNCLPNMRGVLVEEVGRAVFFENPPPSWPEKIGRLFGRVIAIQRTDTDREMWRTKREEFEGFFQRPEK